VFWENFLRFMVSYTKSALSSKKGARWPLGQYARRTNAEVKQRWLVIERD
jgi:hypothetical protein